MRSAAVLFEPILCIASLFSGLSLRLLHDTVTMEDEVHHALLLALPSELHEHVLALYDRLAIQKCGRVKIR